MADQLGVAAVSGSAATAGSGSAAAAGSGTWAAGKAEMLLSMLLPKNWTILLLKMTQPVKFQLKRKSK